MKLAAFLALGVGVSLSAPLPSVEMRSTVTAELADRWTKRWQRRLDLSEWQISTSIVRKTDLKPETLGNLHWDTDKHSATIRVLDPRDYELASAEIPADIEYTIVHELVHLQLSVLPRDLSTRTTEERVVNKIAEALFKLEKGPTYRPHVFPAKNADVKSKSSTEASRTQ